MFLGLIYWEAFLSRSRTSKKLILLSLASRIMYSGGHDDDDIDGGERMEAKWEGGRQRDGKLTEENCLFAVQWKSRLV